MTKPVFEGSEKVGHIWAVSPEKMVTSMYDLVSRRIVLSKK